MLEILPTFEQRLREQYGREAIPVIKEILERIVGVVSNHYLEINLPIPSNISKLELYFPYKRLYDIYKFIIRSCLSDQDRRQLEPWWFYPYLAVMHFRREWTVETAYIGIFSGNPEFRDNFAANIVYPLNILRERAPRELYEALSNFHYELAKTLNTTFYGIVVKYQYPSGTSVIRILLIEEQHFNALVSKEERESYSGNIIWKRGARSCEDASTAFLDKLSNLLVNEELEVES